MNKSSHEISLEMDEVEKQIREAENNLYVVEQEKLQLDKEVIVLQGKRKDYQISIDKAKHNIRELKSKFKELERAFWRARTSGL